MYQAGILSCLANIVLALEHTLTVYIVCCHQWLGVNTRWTQRLWSGFPTVEKLKMMEPNKLRRIQSTVQFNFPNTSHFTKEMHRSMYSTIHALGLVPASTIPRDGASMVLALAQALAKMEWCLYLDSHLSRNFPRAAPSGTLWTS